MLTRVQVLFDWRSLSDRGRRSLYRGTLILQDHGLKPVQAPRPRREDRWPFKTFTQRPLCLCMKPTHLTETCDTLVVTHRTSSALEATRAHGCHTASPGGGNEVSIQTLIHYGREGEYRQYTAPVSAASLLSFHLPKSMSLLFSKRSPNIFHLMAFHKSCSLKPWCRLGEQRRVKAQTLNRALAKFLSYTLILHC